MQLPPVEVYLTWPEGNYTNPSEVRGPTIYILTYLMVPLLTVLVCLRSYTRLRLTKNFGPDDIAIVLATIPTLACAVLTILAVTYHGWDRHVWDVPTNELEIALKYALTVEILFSLACSLTRLSILLLIMRVMTAGRSILKHMAIVVMVVVSVEEFIFCMVALNTCRPVSAYWTLSFAPQQCINEAAHLLAAGILNSVNDFCVVLIPIPVVMKLRLPLRQRIVCALLFGAGFIVCIAGSVRIYYTYQLNTTYDKTWLAYPTWIAGTIELYLGIIATSIPAIKPLVTRYFPNILGHTFTKHGRSQNDHIKTLEPYVERANMKSPFSDPSIDLIKVSSNANKISIETTVSVEKSFRSEKSSPSTKPVVSAFSTYSKTELPTEKGRNSPHTMGEWKRSNPSPVEEEGEASDSGNSSFDSTWTPGQQVADDLVSPNRVKTKESREELVRKVSKERSSLGPASSEKR